MRDYEVVYIFKSSLTTDEIEARLKGYHAKILVGEGSEITAVEHWGKRQLAYPIDRNDNGYYVVTQFTASPTVLADFERALKLDDDLLRHLVVLSEGELPVPLLDDRDDDRGRDGDRNRRGDRGRDGDRNHRGDAGKDGDGDAAGDDGDAGDAGDDGDAGDVGDAAGDDGDAAGDDGDAAGDDGDAGDVRDDGDAAGDDGDAGDAGDGDAAGDDEGKE